MEASMPGILEHGAQPKRVHFCITESPPDNGSKFAVSHSLDSPSRSPECSNCGLSVMSIEQIYKAKLKEVAEQHAVEMAQLTRQMAEQIRQRDLEIIELSQQIAALTTSGLSTTNRSDREAEPEEVERTVETEQAEADLQPGICQLPFGNRI